VVLSNLRFLFLFLPAVLLLYYLVPRRYKNDVLLSASVVFYGFGSWSQTLLLAADTAVNYALSAGTASRGKLRRFWFWLSAAANAALLVFFKCQSRIPVGISFYTFQMIAYQADVFRGSLSREKSLLRFSTFLFFFPKLQEGPILRYGDMSGQLAHPVCRMENLEEGFRMLALGLTCKALLADKLAGLWRQIAVVGSESISTPFAWLGMAAYSMQLYFDFQGYSLMAIGIGRMFGFSFPQNFDSPYCSVSVSEFYRRWHITLGRWFRDYIYIPMGGSRAGTARTMLNLLTVWALTGLWHGLRWNFLLWGLSLFALIALEKLFLKRYLERRRLLGHLYVLFVIPLTWMLFANTAFADLAVYFRRLFPLFQTAAPATPQDWIFYGKGYLPYLLAGCVFLLPQPQRFLLEAEGKHRILSGTVLSALFWASVWSVHTSAGNPFMYLQF
jgi:alginate O-acetyltransferase complex protein AlgI